MGLKNAGGPSPGDTGSRSVGKQLESWRSRDAMGGIRVNSDVRTNVELIPYSATGGTKITQPNPAGPGNIYIHVFDSPGTFVVSGVVEPTVNAAEILVVAGGGGGGGRFYAGGGGAGGVVHNPSIVVDSSMPVTVGAGGNPGPDGPYDNTVISMGEDSVLGVSPTVTITAKGGGSGGMNRPGATGAAGVTGGSGGGPAQYAANSTTPGNQPSQNPGIPGWTNYGNTAYGQAVHPAGTDPTGNPWFHGAGGGGAGGINQIANDPTGTYQRGGPGGNGQAFPNFPAPLIVPNITFPGDVGHSDDRTLTGMGTDGYFGQGGGGASYFNVGPGYWSNVNTSGQPQWTGNAYVGKLGGGGAGGGDRDDAGANGWPACYLTGSGGGGANYNTPAGNCVNPYNPVVGAGGSGGPGCVMIRYIAE